ncbi:MAG: glycosyltransferase [Rhodospirillales bacterium]|nr:MAG: glycosyltransferase [Rhodospirillales bacterium]
MSAPLVTLGLTTFNAAGTVQRAVRSATEQSWRNFEIVAVDDCSHDGTLDILRRLAAASPEIRVFCNAANVGVAGSRNRILGEARGEFVAFFDDDDESLPERIASQIKRILDYEREFAGGAPVICHTARRVVYPDGTVRVEPTMGQTVGRRAPAGLAVARRILLGTPLEDGYGACPTCCQMARLSTYRAVGGFDPALRRGEDTDFNIRLARAGGHFVGIAKPLVIQTMTKTSEKSLAEEYDNWLRLIEKHRDLLEEAGQFSFCRRWIEAKQAFLERRHLVFIRRLASLALAHPGHTGRRVLMALPNLGLNRRFGRFHEGRP